MIDLQWTEPQLASDNKSDTEGECFTVRILSWSIWYHLFLDNLKTHLKSAYKELEKAPKTNVRRIDGLVREAVCVLLRMSLNRAFRRAFANRKVNTTLLNRNCNWSSPALRATHAHRRPTRCCSPRTINGKIGSISLRKPNKIIINALPNRRRRSVSND